MLQNILMISGSFLVGFMLGLLLRSSNRSHYSDFEDFLTLHDIRLISAYLARSLPCDNCPALEECRIVNSYRTCPETLADHLVKNICLIESEEVKMFILFECCSSDPDKQGSFEYMDAMGFTLSEEAAMKWRDENPEYRSYKYCSNREIYAEE